MNLTANRKVTDRVSLFPLFGRARARLAMKVLTKTCDATSLTADKFDLATLTKNAEGKIVYHVFTEAEAQKLLELAKAEAASADA